MAKKGITQFWLSYSNTTTEPFTQFGVSLFQSEQFKTLHPLPRHTYLCMCMEAKGKREFKFPRSVALRYGIKPATLWEAVKELEESGFIKKKNSGKNTRTPNEYKFISEWKHKPVKVPP